MNEKECGMTSDYANCVRFEMASYIFYIPEDHIVKYAFMKVNIPWKE